MNANMVGSSASLVKETFSKVIKSFGKYSNKEIENIMSKERRRKQNQSLEQLAKHIGIDDIANIDKVINVEGETVPCLVPHVISDRLDDDFMEFDKAACLRGVKVFVRKSWVGEFPPELMRLDNLKRPEYVIVEEVEPGHRIRQEINLHHAAYN